MRRTPPLDAFGGRAPPAGSPEAPAGGPETDGDADEGPLALSVSQVVHGVDRLLGDAAHFGDVLVQGELSQFTAHRSGHWYFSVKDEGAVLNATMFAGDNRRIVFDPEEGMEVLLRGRVGVFARFGKLQIVVRDMRPVGAGALAARFEQLKRKLAAEGLFDPARKRAIPAHARTIGVVTSLSGAALRDIIHVAHRRDPSVRLIVRGARVQGLGAAEEVADAIRRLDALQDRDGDPARVPDVLIVGRGGGSLEDLWAFNEEPVVRAVAACRTPVVSAVGHETDVTLCDLVADLRAATPSTAAETVVPDAAALAAEVARLRRRLADALARLVPELHQRLDDLAARAERSVRALLERLRERVDAYAARLGSLSPEAVLQRGYAYVRRDGRAVTEVSALAPGDAVEVVFAAGLVDAEVRGVRPREPRKPGEGKEEEGRDASEIV